MAAPCSFLLSLLIFSLPSISYCSVGRTNAPTAKDAIIQYWRLKFPNKHLPPFFLSKISPLSPLQLMATSNIHGSHAIADASIPEPEAYRNPITANYNSEAYKRHAIMNHDSNANIRHVAAIYNSDSEKHVTANHDSDALTKAVATNYDSDEYKKPITANYNSDEYKKPTTASYDSYSNSDYDSDASRNPITATYDSDAYRKPATASFNSDEYKKPATVSSNYDSDASRNPITVTYDSDAYRNPITATYDFDAYRKPATASFNSDEYKKPATRKVAKRSSNRNVFFREINLTKGTIMPMCNIKSTMPHMLLLPRSMATTLPFSSPHEVKEHLRIPGYSRMSKEIDDTISTCKSAPSKGEAKACLTSAEDVIDFISLKLGPNAILKSTESAQGSEGNIMIGEVKSVKGDELTELVACHRVVFPNMVYLCHSVPRAKMYEADILNAETKERINRGIAICHFDTSNWSKGHLAFAELGLKPGEIEVCHWIFEGEMAAYAE